MLTSDETSEAKIVFRDGEDVRVIRGRISEEDTFFFTVQRRDGTILIGKDTVIKVEKWNNNRSVEGHEKKR